MSAVTKEDVARLHAYLVVPVAVNDAIVSGVPLDGETQYGLHVSLSEIDPDSALLAIALSAHHIATEFIKEVPSAVALKMESEKIIEQYGPEWLSHYHNAPMQGDDLYDLLCHIPEDLEAMADLLESVQTSIRNEDDPSHALCAVLAIQARAHMEIAEYVISELENEKIGEEGDFDGVCAFESPALLAQQEPYVDNIILFPLHRRR